MKNNAQDFASKLGNDKKEEEENKNEGGFLSPTSYYINAEVPNSNELDERGNRKQWSADFSSANEFGSKRELRKDPRAFNDKWLASQTQWLANAYKTLKPSGRMLVMIGDGANVNALRSTVDVAERVGFERLASCSLAVCEPQVPEPSTTAREKNTSFCSRSSSSSNNNSTRRRRRRRTKNNDAHKTRLIHA